ncbi:MAG: hypothetical protein KDC38_20885, partial [Planctomycetes bacterium]|nr:hypothetical protein [Planctomycetota bacterium]
MKRSLSPWRGASALALAIAVSSCGAPGPVYLSQVQEAQKDLAAGDPEQAQRVLRGIGKLSEGSKLEQLEFHLTLARTLTYLGILSEPVFLGEDLTPQKLERRKRSIDTATGHYRDARQHFHAAAELLPVDADGRSKVDDQKDRYEIELGIGLSYLREGILLQEPQWLREADKRFATCDQIARGVGGQLGADPRLIFYRARQFQPAGKLNQSIVEQLMV